VDDVSPFSERDERFRKLEQDNDALRRENQRLHKTSPPAGEADQPAARPPEEAPPRWQAPSGALFEKGDPKQDPKRQDPWTTVETHAILIRVEHVSTCQTPRARSAYSEPSLFGRTGRPSTLPHPPLSGYSVGETIRFRRF